MRAVLAILGACVSLPSFAVEADGFDPGAYVQIEVILFATQAPEGATNRTGVRPEVLQRTRARAFPTGLVSIANAHLKKAPDASWFDREWSLIAPGLLDEMPAPPAPIGDDVEVEVNLDAADEARLQAELEEEEKEADEDDMAEVAGVVAETAGTAVIAETPPLWQRYRAWYMDLMANCYSQVEQDNWRLSRALAALERSSAHRVLMHGAWIQPISPRPRPVLLSGGEAGEVGVLSLTRTGFIEADVRFWRPLASGYAELFEVRPMRSRRAYYFDHPMMGVIVRVDPIRVPSEFR